MVNGITFISALLVYDDGRSVQLEKVEGLVTLHEERKQYTLTLVSYFLPMIIVLLKHSGQLELFQRAYIEEQDGVQLRAEYTRKDERDNIHILRVWNSSEV